MVKKKINDAEQEGVSVKQFAEEIGVTPDRLLSQFKDAGITIASVNDTVLEEQKQKLLQYLQQHHGAAKKDGTPEKIVLRRAKTSEIKLGRTHGAGKTVSIQVRKKRTYVKRTTADEENAKAEEVAAEQHDTTTAQTEAPAQHAPTADVKLELVAPAPSQSAVGSRAHLDGRQCRCRHRVPRARLECGIP